MKTQRSPEKINNFTRVRGKTNHGCIIVKRGNWSSDGNHVFDRCPECGHIRLYWQCWNEECEVKNNTLISGVLIPKKLDDRAEKLKVEIMEPDWFISDSVKRGYND